MSEHQRRLLLASFAYLVVACIGTAIAVDENLSGKPLGLTTGMGSRRNFLMGLGTALSSPLVGLVLLVVLVSMSVAPGRTGSLGLVALGVCGVGFALAMLAEPIHVQGFEPGGL